MDWKYVSDRVRNTLAPFELEARKADMERGLRSPRHELPGEPRPGFLRRTWRRLRGGR